MGPEQIRVIFLVALFIVLVVLAVRFFTSGTFSWLISTLLDIVLLGAILLTGTTFFLLLFRIDPMPYIRQGAYLLSVQQNVSFDAAIPPNLEQNLQVAKIEKVDTDTDGYKEWVVFYRFDRRGEVGPIQGVVYDNDRGDPPVIFPYNLRPPGRDYLTEGQPFDFSLEMRPIGTTQSESETSPLEVVIESNTDLSIFRFRQNSTEWDFPRDAPPRYESIGFFRGNGGVSIDEINKVTVKDRDGYERSQLVTRSIYELNPITNTYWDRFYEWTELDRKLAAPVFATIDFLNGPPDSILDSSFPEAIVLGFYASTCVGENETLCSSVSAGWNPGDFLAGDALREFQNNNPDFFGLPGFKGTQRLAVTDLRYSPSLETDPDLLVSGGGRDVVTGEQAQRNEIDISFKVNDAKLNTLRFKVDLVNGQWKITGQSKPPSPAITPEPPANEAEGTVAPAEFPPPTAEAPTAEANGPYTAMMGKGEAIVTLDGSSSRGTIVRYEWDFGDGTAPITGQRVTHGYTSIGSYEVTLTVIDDRGNISRDTALVTIVGPTPQAAN